MMLASAGCTGRGDLRAAGATRVVIGPARDLAAWTAGDCGWEERPTPAAKQLECRASSSALPGSVRGVPAAR
jgi:hypothetical protein